MANIKTFLSLSLLSIALMGQSAYALTQVDQATVDAAKAKIVEACPVRWEDHSQRLVLPTEADDDIWEDTADRDAFVAYLTVVLTEMESDKDANDLADDIGTVAAECATQRTALLDLLLIKEPNDVVLGMRSLKKTLETQSLANKDGSSQELASKSCKQIKEAFPESTDGTYWIDVTYGNTNDAMEVYCDMTTDGGGWTFIAFISGTQNHSVNGNFFEQAVGTYEPTRIATNQHYSLGILPEMDDTEMIIVRNTAEIASANDPYSNGIGGLLWFKYTATSPAFNFGPIPCSAGGFSFRRKLTEDFIDNGVFTSCDTSAWYTAAPSNWYGGDVGQRYFGLFHETSNGLIIGQSAKGTNGHSYNNKVWIYVR